jgi:hypothetical protein
LLLPWRRLVVETSLPPERAQASIARAAARELVWKFTASSGGFRFVKLAGPGHRDWIVVLGAIEPRPFGSHVSVELRAPLSQIIAFGLGSLFVPGAILGAAFAHGQGPADLNRYLVFGMVIGPCAWCVLSLITTHHARKIERWLRGALPAVVSPDDSPPTTAHENGHSGGSQKSRRA